MKFAFFIHLPWPEDTVPKRIIEQTTQQVQYAEDTAALDLVSGGMEHSKVIRSMECSPEKSCPG